MKSKQEELLYWACRCEESGLCVPMTGNMSLLDEENQVILMTPSGIDRRRAKPEEMSILTLDGKWVDGKKPTSEYQMHIKVYQTRNDVKGVIHTHSRFATTLAVCGKEIPPILYEVALLGGAVPVAPYARPGTEALAEVVSAVLVERDVCLLEKHGALAVGKTIEDAFIKALYIEETAAVYYQSVLLLQGKEPEVMEWNEIAAWKYPDLKKLKFT